MWSVIAMLVPLVILIGLAYRGGAVVILAPLCAALAAGLTQQPVMAALTERFAPATGGFIVNYLLIFLLGAVFGRLMEVTGAARRLAETIARMLGQDRAILAVTLACAVLTYGGVSLFVVAFATYPLARALFRLAELPDRLIPAAIALGAFTFTMTALPGTPAIQNAIPMPYFGTTTYAAPGFGVLAAAIMAFGGLAYLNWRGRIESRSVLVTRSLPDAYEDVGIGVSPAAPTDTPRVSLTVALIPIFVVLVCNLVFSNLLFPSLDLTYLSDPQWNGVTPDSVVGTWSLILALTAGIGALLVLTVPRVLPNPLKTLGEGGEAALLPLMNTAVLVGFGSVIAASDGFTVLRDLVATLPGGTLVQLALTVSILAGVTGSASGGMSIALSSLGDSYTDMARADGTSFDVMHRVTSLATGGLDALPHNGAVVTLLGIGKLTHRAAYGPIFVVAVLIPLVVLITVLIVASL